MAAIPSLDQTECYGDGIVMLVHFVYASLKAAARALLFLDAKHEAAHDAGRVTLLDLRSSAISCLMITGPKQETVETNQRQPGSSATQIAHVACIMTPDMRRSVIETAEAGSG